MDEFSAAPMRRLPWDLREQAAMSADTGADTEDVSPFVWPEDPDERTLVPFYLSQREYTAIASAVDAGSDIAFSTDAIRVWWLFVRNMRYAVPICDLVTTAILTCEDVQAAIATLIATNPVIQDALRDFVTDDPEINQHISNIAIKITEGQITGKIIAGSCDNSVVAGKVVAIIERMNDRNIDFLEILEIGTNDEEKVSNIISAIPGLSELPADEIIDMAQDLLEDFAENYNAAVTEDWKDEVEEDLYCLAKESEDCSLSYQQLFDYFQSRVGSGLTIASVLHNVVQFVLNGDFPTDDLVASGLYAIQLGFILAGQEFNGMSVPTLGSLTRDAATSSKWEDWDECASAIWDEWDFEGGDQHDWTAVVGSMDFADFDNGWIVDEDPPQIAIKRAYASQSYDKVEVYFESPVPGAMVASSVGNFDATGFVTATSSDDQKFTTPDHLFAAGFFLDFYNSTTLVGAKIVKVRARRA